MFFLIIVCDNFAVKFDSLKSLAYILVYVQNFKDRPAYI